jgi:hypothetical protein
VFRITTVNVIWAITALVTGLSFLLGWNKWECQKQKAIVGLIFRRKSEGSRDLEARLSALQAMRPFGPWNMVTSGVTVVSSFALPILQAILK